MIALFIMAGCQQEEQIAKETYDTYCGLCHGYDGEGYLAPQANALANPEFLAASTDDFFFDMPSFMVAPQPKCLLGVKKLVAPSIVKM